MSVSYHRLWTQSQIPNRVWLKMFCLWMLMMMLLSGCFPASNPSVDPIFSKPSEANTKTAKEAPPQEENAKSPPDLSSSAGFQNAPPFKEDELFLLIYRVNAWLIENQPQYALPMLEQVVKQIHHSPLIYEYLGHTYLLLGEREKAISAFTQATQIMPEEEAQRLEEFIVQLVRGDDTLIESYRNELLGREVNMTDISELLQKRSLPSALQKLLQMRDDENETDEDVSFQETFREITDQDRKDVPDIIQHMLVGNVVETEYGYMSIPDEFTKAAQFILVNIGRQDADAVVPSLIKELQKIRNRSKRHDDRYRICAISETLGEIGVFAKDAVSELLTMFDVEIPRRKRIIWSKPYGPPQNHIYIPKPDPEATAAMVICVLKAMKQIGPGDVNALPTLKTVRFRYKNKNERVVDLTDEVMDAFGAGGERH